MTTSEPSEREPPPRIPAQWQPTVRRFGQLAAVAAVASVLERLLFQYGVPLVPDENFELRQATDAIVIGLVSVASGLLFWAAALLGAMLAARWAFGRPLREALDL